MIKLFLDNALHALATGGEAKGPRTKKHYFIDENMAAFNKLTADLTEITVVNDIEPDCKLNVQPMLLESGWRTRFSPLPSMELANENYHAFDVEPSIELSLAPKCEKL